MITYRRTWVENTYYVFCFPANMLNIKSLGFDRVHYDIWWKVLIKFGKEVANTFCKNI